MTSGATATVAENAATSTLVYQATATDPDGTAPNNTINWSLSGADAAAFSIDVSGNVTLNSSADFETKNSYSIDVIATDGGGLFSSKAVTVSVTDVNEAPTEILVSNAAVQQSTTSGTAVGALSAVDPDFGDIATFSLVDGAGGQFDVSGGNIVVAGPLSLGVQQVTVRATDAGGLTFEKTIMIDVNADAPIVGDAGPNTLIGTSGDDLIQGLGGSDRLQGLGGNDVLDGGAGFDRAIYTDATGGITADLAAGTVTGAGVGSDTLVGIEGIVGSDFADSFTAAGFNGDSGVPGIPLGFTEFEGMGGDDLIIGSVNALGQITTRISYVSATGSVTVDLAAGTADGDVSVGHDTFSNVNSIVGSGGNDTFYGSNNPSFTYETYEGRGGDDYIDGRGGYDQVNYQNDPLTASGIVVHLALGTVTGDATVGTDTIRDVEAARGTAFDDVFDATGYGLAGALNFSSTNGSFNDFGGGGGDDTIIGNGNTRLNYQIAAASVSVDLEITAGTTVTVAGAATGATEGTDTFTGVNAVQGSMFGDTLLGSSFNNTITGLGGDDYIDGRGGFDTASYNSLSTVTGGVTVSMAAGIVTGDASIGTDTLLNIEGIQGTMLADSYDATGYGLAGAANISTSNGNFNQFEGLGGDDTITGNGNTRVLYSNATAGVTVTLGAGGAGSAHGTAGGDTATVGTDTFIGGVNAAIGSNFADIFDASAFDAGLYNSFQGQGGDDVIIGNGNTQIQFGNATSGVTVNLAAGTADGDGSTGHDTFTGISGVSGSNFGDIISGGIGNDQLFGNGGDDVIGGGAGNDFLNGGAGADTFVFVSGGGSDTIADFNQGQGDRIDVTGVAGIYDLSDIQSHATQQGPNTVIDFGGGDIITLQNVTLGNLVTDDFIFPSAITGTSAADVLVGTSQADVISGLAGNDRLQGLAGDDTLDGGTGFDRTIYTDATGGVTVDLAAGTAAGPGVGTDTLIGIEGIVGGAFADNLSAAGFAGDSGIAGTPTGFNEIEGGGGDDTITSAVNSQGALLTRISYANASSGVVVDLNAHTATGGDGNDTLVGSGFAGVVGSGFDDQLLGSNNAAGTVEVFEGRAGNDTINGRGGFDRADYAQDPAAQGTGITVNLAIGQVIGDATTVGTDTLLSIESVRGSNSADIFDATGFGNGQPATLNIGNNGTFNEFNGMGGDDTIIGNGNTRITFINATGGVTVDLQTGATPGTGTAHGDASTGDDTFSGVNAIQASMFDDTLYGSNSTTTTETFFGGGGNDYINGRGGFDLATYNNIYFSTGPVTVDMGAGTVTGDASIGSDTLRSIEAVQGTNFNDTFDASTFGTGTAQNIGNNGTFNQFEGLGGNDTVTGNGNTRLIYSSATAGVTINMLAGTATGDGSVGTDTFTGVNSVTGSASADIYDATGFGNFNLFEGLGGSDDITGNGNTRVAYSQATGSVTVNLATGLVSGAAGADVIHGGVNSVQGSKFDDTLIGSSGNELFFGGGGADTINAGGGNDQITGQGGNDIIDGGAGTDVVFFTGAQSQYTISLDTPGVGQIQVTDFARSGAGRHRRS